MFLIFLNYFSILYDFFWECSSQGYVEIVLGMKFFYRFYGVSRPSLARNKARMMFFNFLNFNTILLGMLKLGLGEMEAEKKFFYLFLFLSWPGLA